MRSCIRATQGSLIGESMLFANIDLHPDAVNNAEMGSASQHQRWQLRNWGVEVVMSEEWPVPRAELTPAEETIRAGQSSERGA